MDYNLDTLGSRNFEHLTQSIVASLIGPKLVVFGDGPDGGREATWRGTSPSFGVLDTWDGYGVLQAKFKLHPEDPAKNLSWLKSAIRDELHEWARVDSKRKEKPEFILFTTNVRLSSVPDSGKDEIHRYITEVIDELHLDVSDFRVWDYYEIVTHLDLNKSIRSRYSAFVTPGDLVAALLDNVDSYNETFGQAIASYTARCLRDESLLNLTQAGTAGDGQVTIDEVFVDLPADLPHQGWLVKTSEATVADREEVDESGIFSDFEGYYSRAGIARHLINDFNHIPDIRHDGKPDPHRTVLIGGPGQGKSTVTQWLAQLYRIEFLRGTKIASTQAVSATSRRIDARHEKLELPKLRARRWPVRIVLTELADYLAQSPDRSLLHYIAHKVSDRSSVDVDPTMLRKWLSDYPWLLLIDGLDEVPASSNRQQVMGSIQDFFLDVATVEGDVAAVATTRPQGYSEEFSPSEYRHFQLQTLTIDEALEYARGLVVVRAGEGTTTATKVLDRLRRASREEHTQKLFESPLQVTILEVLLEKLGKAPSDRSRLYSAYYNVISQREQEKSGELSDLLQRYESDVDYLHRRIGFELQQRGSAVGETSSSLSIQEFDRFILERFKDQGHLEGEVESLSRDFSALVTDRLVFLAKLQADRIGFELRSLQEFMAAEHIVNLPESDVIGEIQGIASSPYWRNVVLFAIGSVFAHREHLKAEVVLLCDRLNDEPRRASVILPGSELAIDVLRDGSCLSMPKYSRSLAKIALRMLEAPHGPTVSTLLMLNGTDLADLLWQDAESLEAGTASSWINRATILSALRATEGDRADLALHRLYSLADDSLKKHLIEWAWDSDDRALGSIIDFDFLRLKPSVYFGSAHRRRFIGNRESNLLPEWMRNLHVLKNRDSGPTPFEDVGEDAVLRASCRQLGLHQDAWDWLASLQTEDDEWAAYQRLAKFALDPTSTSLGDVLEATRSVPDGIGVPVAPWPYLSCVRFARHRSRADNTLTMGEALRQLADLARRGALGDSEDWLSAQSRWGGAFAVTAEFVTGSASTSSSLPMDPSLKDEGYVPSEYSYNSSDSHSERGIRATYELARLMTDHESDGPLWTELAVFLGSMLARRVDVENTVDFDHLYDLLEEVLPAEGHRAQWIEWIGLVPMTEARPSRRTLQILGSQQWLVGELDDKRSEQLLDKGRGDAGGLALARLALTSKPTLIRTLTKDEAEELALGGDAILVGALVQIVEALAAGEHEIWAGSLDDRLLQIASSEAQAFGPSWFISMLEELGSTQAQNLSARGASVLADVRPRMAERWLDVARKLYQERDNAGPHSSAPVAV